MAEADTSSIASDSGSFCRHAKGTLEEVVEEAIKQQFKVFCLSEHAPRSVPTASLQRLLILTCCSVNHPQISSTRPLPRRGEPALSPRLRSPVPFLSSQLTPPPHPFCLTVSPPSRPFQSDLNPSSLSTIFTSYLDTAHSLRALHSRHISLPIGLETDLITPLDLTQLLSLLATEQHRIDFVVGSLHHVNEIPIDFDQPTFQRAVESFPGATEDERMTKLLHAYFDAQMMLLEEVQPEVVGHFDLVRLWEPRMDFKRYEGVWEKVERNVRFVVGYGGLFEVNAAAFRKGWDEAYPAWDVLEVRPSRLTSQGGGIG